jgi:hypothetical protein
LKSRVGYRRVTLLPTRHFSPQFIEEVLQHHDFVILLRRRIPFRPGESTGVTNSTRFPSGDRSHIELVEAAAPSLASCLGKDPKWRLRDIGDMGRLLEETSGTASPALKLKGREAASLPNMAWIAAAVPAAAAISGWLAFFVLRPKPAAVLVQRKFDIASKGEGILSPLECESTPSRSECDYHRTGGAFPLRDRRQQRGTLTTIIGCFVSAPWSTTESFPSI